jgi:hypothetical protein
MSSNSSAAKKRKGKKKKKMDHKNPKTPGTKHREKSL